MSVARCRVGEQTTVVIEAPFPASAITSRIRTPGESDVVTHAKFQDNAKPRLKVLKCRAGLKKRRL